MRIEEIDLADVDSLAEVFMKAFNSKPWNDNWTKENARERITVQLENPNNIGFVAKEDGDVVGFLLGYLTILPEGKTLFIEDLCKFQR